MPYTIHARRKESRSSQRVEFSRSPGKAWEPALPRNQSSGSNERQGSGSGSRTSRNSIHHLEAEDVGGTCTELFFFFKSVQVAQRI